MGTTLRFYPDSARLPSRSGTCELHVARRAVAQRREQPRPGEPHRPRRGRRRVCGIQSARPGGLARAWMDADRRCENASREVPPSVALGHLRVALPDCGVLALPAWRLDRRRGGASHLARRGRRRTWLVFHHDLPQAGHGRGRLRRDHACRRDSRDGLRHGVAQLVRPFPRHTRPDRGAASEERERGGTPGNRAAQT